MTLVEKLKAAGEGSFDLGAQVVCYQRGLKFLSVEPRATALHPYTMAVAAEDQFGDRFEFWAIDPTQDLTAAMGLKPEGAEYEISTIYGIANVSMPLNGGDAFPPINIRREDGNVILAFVECALAARGVK